MPSDSATTRLSRICRLCRWHGQAQKRTKRINFFFLQSELQHQGHAVQTFADVDKAVTAYYMITGKTLTPLGLQSTLSDFNAPSDDHKNRELLFIIVVMGVTGFAAYTLF